MRSLYILGLVLIVLSAGGLLFDHFTYTDTKPLLDAGPIHVTTQETHSLSIPKIGGIVILLAGIGLVVISRRAA